MEIKAVDVAIVFVFAVTLLAITYMVYIEAKNPSVRKREKSTTSD
jgi:hypothetical protein